MKHLHVTCALIETGNNVLCAQRSATMNMPLKWEFPGGKMHEGETPGECLIRECSEELGIVIDIVTPGPACSYRYPAFDITLYPFTAIITSGTIGLTEHASAVWLPPEKLMSLDWAEADIAVVEWYMKLRR